jgi:hypothetical protein
VCERFFSLLNSVHLFDSALRYFLLDSLNNMFRSFLFLILVQITYLASAAAVQQPCSIRAVSCVCPASTLTPLPSIVGNMGPSKSAHLGKEFVCKAFDTQRLTVQSRVSASELFISEILYLT